MVAGAVHYCDVVKMLAVVGQGLGFEERNLVQIGSPVVDGVDSEIHVAAADSRVDALKDDSTGVVPCWRTPTHQ